MSTAPTNNPWSLNVFRVLGRDTVAWGLLAVLHLAALAILMGTEDELVGRFAFLFAWGLLNSLWLVVLRRPAAAAALSLVMFVVLILLSQFKQNVVLMSANFVDVMLIDKDTVTFLLTVFPKVIPATVIAAVVVLPLLALCWWADAFRVRRWTAALGAAASLAALSALSLAVPMDREKAFASAAYVSEFMRSGVLAMVDIATRGVLESDSFVADRLPQVAPVGCQPGQRLPHIVLVLDESSFDISTVRGIKVPQNYRRRFQSFDGNSRALMVEGAGGPTWYTEYNVLTGLSAKSYGRFSNFVTRIAGGRVSRSLPNALRPCGYRSYSLYPWYGAFLGARYFQKSIGIDRFLDTKDLGTRNVEPDRFYYDFTADLIRRDGRDRPLFVMTYLMANHFSWGPRYRPDLMPGWRDLGNPVIDGERVDEYLRRQEMSARDYRAFVERLHNEFPSDPFLIVRFGDHQPLFAKKIIDPTLDDIGIGRRIDAGDPRYFTTYYAIDALNFRPADLSLAFDGLDAAYLPLIILEAAGVPLDGSFVEQRRILKECNGLFYLCAGGAKVRRFNRMLIDAGFIKGL
jgi:hypothetical protein